MNDINRDIDKEREKYLISMADAYGLMPFSSEFSNFLNAKGKLKKGLKKFGDQVKGGIKKVGRGVAVVTIAVPRTAFLSLLDLNYRGFGWKIQSILTNPALKKEKEQLKKKWEKLGGKFSALEKTAGIGSRREKAFFCGKECKTKLLDKDLSKQALEDLKNKPTDNFSNFNINSNFFTGSYIDNDKKYSNVAESVIIGAWIGAGASVIGALGGIISKGIESADQKKMLKSEEEKTKLELASISESDKKKIELAEKQLKAQSDPRDIILKNENLTPAEKKEALAVVDDATSKSNISNFKKYFLYSAIGLVVLIVIYQVTKKK
jgi:hypothetical protein